MITIQPTTSIIVDDITFEVSNMSAEIQQMIQYLDDWRQDEADQASQLLKTRAALQDIQNKLLQQIQKEKEAAALETSDAVASELVE
jgi:hypothetical protein